MTFTICDDYSSITGLRHCSITDYSGEDFYHTKLNEAFAESYQKDDKLVLVLDGTLDGYTPSFIDEAIGNLVYDFSLDVVNKYLVVVSNNDSQWPFLLENKTFPNWEKRRKNNEAPVITKEHGAWYRLSKGKLEKRVWITPKNNV